MNSTVTLHVGHCAVACGRCLRVSRMGGPDGDDDYTQKIEVNERGKTWEEVDGGGECQPRSHTLISDYEK